MVLFSINDSAEEEWQNWYGVLTLAKLKVYLVADHIRDLTHSTGELCYNIKRYYDVGEDELFTTFILYNLVENEEFP